MSRCSLRRFVGLARLRARAGELSVVRQCAELLWLYPVHGVGPSFYQMAGFWKRDVFEACLDLVRQAIRIYPKLNFCGFDVALTEKGPILVESNPVPDRTGATYMRLPTRQALAI